MAARDYSCNWRKLRLLRLHSYGYADRFRAARERAALVRAFPASIKYQIGESEIVGSKLREWHPSALVPGYRHETSVS